MLKYIGCIFFLLNIYSNRKDLVQNHKKIFDNTKPFEIISFEKYFENSTDTDTAKCKNWKLKKENIKRIIKHGKPIGGTKWDLTFSVLSCAISGKLLQNYNEYKLSINAGSFFLVRNKDTTLLFGDFNKSDSKYFIDQPNP